MAIVHEDKSTFAVNSLVTSANVAKPPNSTEGEWLLAVLALDTPGTTPSSSGWTTQLDRFAVPAGTFNGTLTLLRKYVGPSEGASYTFSWGGAGALGAIGISRFSGVDLTTAIEAQTTASSSSPSTTHTAPTVTTLSNNAHVVRIYATADTIVSWTISGPVERWDVTSTGEGAAMLASAEQAVAGASGTQNATCSPTSRRATVSLSLKAAISLDEPVVTTPRSSYLYY